MIPNSYQESDGIMLFGKVGEDQSTGNHVDSEEFVLKFTIDNHRH